MQNVCILPILTKHIDIYLFDGIFFAHLCAQEFKVSENATNNSPRPEIWAATSSISSANRWDHFLARVGFKRSEHRVAPGLYAIGNPAPDSPVFVTANYSLSFDALRSALVGIDGYILVLDTQGVNVWCAAGKGTFGTDELVKRIEATRLHEVVDHRKLILPQLGAPGIAAHEVKKRSKFKVEYGPVRADDLPAYLETKQATPELRRVRFPLRERLVLIPVELIHLGLLVLVLTALIAVLGVFTPVKLNYGILIAYLVGVVLFPVLLPWLPTRDFSSKGFILGGLIAVPLVLGSLLGNPGALWWQQVGSALALFMTIMPATAFFALNFTGSTTFTSRSGVRREMFAYIPLMAWTFGTGLILEIVFSLI